MIYKFISLALLFILIIILVYQSYLYHLNKKCYDECSKYHFHGLGEHWAYEDYMVYKGDTIWFDKTCYNAWCICIDECNPGQCCELLNY